MKIGIDTLIIKNLEESLYCSEYLLLEVKTAAGGTQVMSTWEHRDRLTDQLPKGRSPALCPEQGESGRGSQRLM